MIEYYDFWSTDNIQGKYLILSYGNMEILKKINL